MAQNWVVTPRKTRALRVIDALSAPFAAASRLRRSERPPPHRILVLEFWQIGDAVLAEPFLRALRDRFPDAHIALLCKAHARTLLEPSRLIDEFIVADIPWTAPSAKYRLRRYVDSGFASLVRRLRRGRFDVSIDARGDVRANALVWLAGIPQRVGFGGPGSALLTDRVRGPLSTSHKVEDWVAMLEPLGGDSTPAQPPAAPRLALRADARARASDVLRAHGVGASDHVVAIHASARMAVRRWPIEGFAAVARSLAERDGVRVVAIVDPDGYGEQLAEIEGVIPCRSSLEELPALLAACDLFVGNDSGPAHIAAAVGTRTVAIFGSAVAAWYRPCGPEHRVIHVADLTCRPCFDRCTQAENFCITRISTAQVIEVVLETLTDVMGAPPRALSLPLAAPEPGYLSTL